MKTVLLFLMMTFLFGESFAAELYPRGLPLRVFGSHQDVGSCLSESYVTALEHKLAGLGGNFKLSLHHAHAAVWSEFQASPESLPGLVLTTESRRLTSAYGVMVPDYILPEDLEGADWSSLGVNVGLNRPAIESMGIYDGSFAPQKFGFGAVEYTFSPGYSNSGNLAAFMDAVKSGQVVTLTFNSGFIGLFDHFTGLLRAPYVTNARYLDEIHHSIAVLGYDDALGGVIVRNTWNDQGEINDMSDQRNAVLKAGQLALFKDRISKRNLPGYYLFPYQYIQDLANAGNASYRVLSFDFGGFANAYSENSSKYEVLNAFYSCNREMTLNRLRSLKKAYQEMQEPALSMKALTYIKDEIYRQIARDRPILNYSKQTRRTDGSVDRIRDFYSGNFIDYYCGANQPNPIRGFWPLSGTDAIASDPVMLEFERRLSADPSSVSTWFDFFKYLTQGV